MLGSIGSSYALFAIVWSTMCLMAAAVVLDTMLRDLRSAPIPPGE